MTVRKSEGTVRAVILGAILSVTATSCGDPDRIDDDDLNQVEEAEQAVTKGCKIGSSSISGLPASAKDCKDANSIAKVLGNLGKSPQARNVEYLHEGEGVIAANFQTAATGATYSLYLQVAGDGQAFLQVDDLNAGTSILQHTTSNTGFANGDYFRALTPAQTGNLTNAINEVVVRRMHGSIGRQLGSAPSGVKTCT